MLKLRSLTKADLQTSKESQALARKSKKKLKRCRKRSQILRRRGKKKTPTTKMSKKNWMMKNRMTKS
ncbi:hypothetical protein D3C71_2149220 [compost metagenome]